MLFDFFALNIQHFQLKSKFKLRNANYQRQFRRVILGSGAPTFSQSHPSQSVLQNYLVNVNSKNQIPSKEYEAQHVLDRIQEIKDEIQGNKELQYNNSYYKQNIQLTRREILLKSQAVQQLIEDFSSIENVIDTIKNGYQPLLGQQAVFNLQNMLTIQNRLGDIKRKLKRCNAEEENQKARIRGLPKQYQTFIFPRKIDDDDEYLKILKQINQQLIFKANDLNGEMDELKLIVGLLIGKIKACSEFLEDSRLNYSRFNYLTFYFDLRFIITNIDETVKYLRN